MKAFAVIAVALLLPQEKNEAENLFKKMEAKITQAKTFQLNYVGTMNPQPFDFTGTLLIDEGNRTRLDMEQRMKSIKGTVLKTFTSNGSKAVFVREVTQRAETSFNTPPTLGKLILTCFSRAGFWTSVNVSNSELDSRADPETAFVASNFKLGPREMVGNRDAQAVEYVLTRKGKKGSLATVWIDISTSLPLKRVLQVEGIHLAEFYSDVKCDEKIDPAKFELPKETK